MSTGRKWLVGTIAVLAVIGFIIDAADGGSDTGTSKADADAPAVTQPVGDTDRRDMNRHTRTYIKATYDCKAQSALLVAALANGALTNAVDAARQTTHARDACDQARNAMLLMDTTHFDKQAQQTWYGVDRIKSGLNAMLAFLDNPEPTKLVEIEDKLREGAHDLDEGLHRINHRRKAYGLAPVKG